MAGQPSSQPVVGDDTGTLADRGSQRPPPTHPLPSIVPPPREASQEGASGPSGVESVAFMLTLPQPPRLAVCVARGEVLSGELSRQLNQRGSTKAAILSAEFVSPSAAVMKSEVKMLCYCSAE